MGGVKDLNARLDLNFVAADCSCVTEAMGLDADGEQPQDYSVEPNALDGLCADTVSHACYWANSKPNGFF